MTVKQLINSLKQYQEDAKVNFWVFSNLTARRGDVPDSNVMIRWSNAENGFVAIMLDLDSRWERDLIDGVKKMISYQNGA